jgi:uncharacterized integral membrane protein
MTASKDTTATGQRASDSPDRKSRQRLIAVVVLGGLLVLFAVLNSQNVRIHWLFSTTNSPLIVVIVISALIGGLIGWAIARRRARRSSAAGPQV